MMIFVDFCAKIVKNMYGIVSECDLCALLPVLHAAEN